MNKKIRKVAIVTGTRAEYGILKPLIEKIHKDSELELELIVTGMHLLRKFGYTIKEIEKDGYPISSKVKMYTKRLYGEKEYYGISLGKGVISFTKALEKIHPDILLVFGDRLEALAATLAASSLNIPIGHIHAGDKTDSGHIDEQVRFAISRFSHILFAPTKKCTERLIKMARFRNLLAYAYAKVDIERVYRELDDNINDLRAFLNTVKKIIDSHKLDLSSF